MQWNTTLLKLTFSRFVATWSCVTSSLRWLKSKNATHAETAFFAFLYIYIKYFQLKNVYHHILPSDLSEAWCWNYLRLLFPFKDVLRRSFSGGPVNTGKHFLTHSLTDTNSPSSSPAGCGSTTRPVSSAFRMENICKETTITSVS